MSATTVDLNVSASPTKLATSGAIAGLAGGAVFGMMMGLMGMLPMIGQLIRQKNAFIGFIVHMVISAFIGAIYGLVFGRFAINPTTALIGGIINGVIWWVLGALVLMPLLLGMPQMILAIDQTQLLSLIGHAIYGLVTSFVFIPLVNRS